MSNATTHVPTFRTFRKRPVEVKAHEWTGDNWPDFLLFLVAAGGTAFVDGDVLCIDTLEGVMAAQPGDWIIREPFPTNDRKFYPCKPDIFEQTYEAVA